MITLLYKSGFSAESPLLWLTMDAGFCRDPLYLLAEFLPGRPVVCRNPLYLLAEFLPGRPVACRSPLYLLAELFAQKTGGLDQKNDDQHAEDDDVGQLCGNISLGEYLDDAQQKSAQEGAGN